MSNSFLPAKLNFPLWYTSTFRYAFQWLDEEGEGSTRKKKPHDLTGYGGLAVLRGDDGSIFELVTAPFEELKGQILFKATSESISEPTQGFVQMYIDTALVKSFTFKKASYELLLKEGSRPIEAPEPDTFPMLTGIFTISRPGTV